MQNLGEKTNLEVLQQFVSLSGQRVIDVGCGSLVFSKLLLEAGAEVLAIDPDPVQAEKNRIAGPIPRLEFQEASATKLPAPSGSVDGVFFAYSLHHIPAEDYPAVVDEVCRVLKPAGFLFVIEPVDCPLNEVMKLFFDEDAERHAAQQALHQLAAPRFRDFHEVTYHGFAQYESFDQFAEHFAGQSFNNLYSETDVRRDEVRAAFEARQMPGGRFQAPKIATFLKHPIVVGNRPASSHA